MLFPEKYLLCTKLKSQGQYNYISGLRLNHLLQELKSEMVYLNFSLVNVVFNQIINQMGFLAA